MATASIALEASCCVQLQSASMKQIRSDDAEIVYEVAGSGPPIVLLHPFPANHQLWYPCVPALQQRYQLILPDLRGHGDSEAGEGPATMAKHAADLARILDAEQVARAIFVGVSIGGYILFEFWRKYRLRVSGIVLCNTKAAGETAASRAARLQAAADVLERGTEPFFESMVTKVFAETTRRTRPDLIEGALAMMRKMSPEDVAWVQRGMAERPDSVETLKTVNVPSLIVTGDEDGLTGASEAELMRRNIAGSEMIVVRRAGHYSPWEQPQEVGRLLRQFADRIHG
ncbi:MAG: alpha/beta fold hydrolase [Acidobacteriaceae bacterium]|nr:alpha/beta fold hydrolase [Acidobacteriaceae bacterium]